MLKKKLSFPSIVQKKKRKKKTQKSKIFSLQNLTHIKHCHTKSVSYVLFYFILLYQFYYFSYNIDIICCCIMKVGMYKPISCFSEKCWLPFWKQHSKVISEKKKKCEKNAGHTPNVEYDGSFYCFCFWVIWFGKYTRK